jgi:hypothetical protein
LRSLKSVFAAALVLVASSALGQQPPKPAPELANVKYFAGSWKCSGNAPASPFGPAHKSESTMTLKLDLDGFWYAGMMTEAKTASNPHPVKGMVHLGYDPAAKKYVMVWVDNFGSWATETSSGWEGDRMVWAGEQNVMGEKAYALDTFVKRGPDQYNHQFVLNMKGQAHTIVEESCRRETKEKKEKK